MKHRDLTIYHLAKENIRRKTFRSFSLISLITLFSFALFAGSVLSISLSRGVDSLSNRLGADVMVVPSGYDAHIDSILLSGEPTSFYLPADVMDKLKTIEGIDKMSPQTYIATLSASCCSYPVQIVGIDYETDFLIKPWLTESLSRELRDGEVIVGNHVAGQSGEAVKFFEKPFKIAGRLEQTGMGFDATVFMTRKTAAKLAIEAERIIEHPLSKDGSLISTVMIKLQPGYDSEKVAADITTRLANDNIFGLFSKKFVNKVSSNLMVVSSYIKITISVIWLLAVVVIALLFALTLNERKKEMATLRVLGATKAKLVRLIMTESSIVSLYGSSMGIGVAVLAIVILTPVISQKLDIPFLLPTLPVIIGVGLICWLVAFLTGPFASLYSALKLSKVDVYKSMREND